MQVTPQKRCDFLFFKYQYMVLLIFYRGHARLLLYTVPIMFLSSFGQDHFLFESQTAAIASTIRPPKIKSIVVLSILVRFGRFKFNQG